MAIIERVGRKRIHGDTDASQTRDFIRPQRARASRAARPYPCTAQRTLVQDDRTRFLFRIDDRAAGPVLRRNLRERGESAGAFWYTESATRLEGAARRHGVQRRDCAFDGTQGTAALGLKVGHGLQEAASIRMRGSVKDLMFAGQFDDTSGIHHGDAVGRPARPRRGRAR